VGRWVRYLIYPYLVILIFFSGSQYGLLEEESSRMIYGRGSGKLFFPFVTWYVFWLAGVVGFYALWNRLPAPEAAVRKFLLLFGLVFLGQLIAAPFLTKSIFYALHYSGTMYLMNAVVFVFVLLRAFRDEKSVRELLILFMVSVFLRDCYGLFRYVFLGGDTANYYANFADLNIKLTFFDINDTILATMAAFMAAARLTDREGMKDRPWTRLVLWGVLILTSVVVILSFRRTAWIGYMAAGAAFLWLYRFAPESHGGLIGALFPDASTATGKLTTNTGRLFELRLALDSIREHILLGVGNWGQYEASSDASVAFHRGQFYFMHSGFLHVWLKTGLIGLVAFAGALYVTTRDSVRLHGAIEVPLWKAFAALGLAGLAVSLPNILFGTPIIEYRTMQILAFILVLPYLARAAWMSPASGVTRHEAR
jgi:O-antigen ligase